MSDSEMVPYFTDPTGREHPLTGDVVTIGRAVENEIVITSKRVSREHARVTREGWRSVLEDLESTNGTYLNDERLVSPTELRDQDRVAIGDVVLIYHDPDITFRDTVFPQLEIDVEGAVVRVDRRVASLSPKEFALLVYLYEHQGQVRSKDEIGEAVWPEYQGEVYDYQVENLVRRLRAKLEVAPGEPRLLITVRGRGYKLATQP
ncbi:MAG: winged helix-turn-helix domain-containing protein [Anaerolineae bacterium]|nr:winged helix-turn-helix domain-containing protein [Anaerolineae bacterium]